MRLAILTALILVPSAAQAQHLTKTAIFGRPLKLNFSNTTIPDCTSAGEAVVRLTQAPAHGRVTISKANDFPSFPRRNVRHACDKKRVAGTQTIYVPDKGFIGTDLAAIEIIFATGATARRAYSIEVK